MRNEDPDIGGQVSTHRPGGTFIWGDDAAINATVVIYTVPDDWELLLTEWWQTSRGTANGTASLRVFSAGAVGLQYLNRQICLVGGQDNMAKDCFPPTILTMRESIRLTSTNVNLTTYAGIGGYIYPI